MNDSGGTASEGLADVTVSVTSRSLDCKEEASRNRGTGIHAKRRDGGTPFSPDPRYPDVLYKIDENLSGH